MQAASIHQSKKENTQAVAAFHIRDITLLGGQTSNPFALQRVGGIQDLLVSSAGQFPCANPISLIVRFRPMKRPGCRIGDDRNAKNFAEKDE
jgi:hypothetical protein